MSSDSNTIAKIFPLPVKHIRKFLTDTASNVFSEAQEATGVVCTTLEQQYKLAAKTVRKAGRKATRLSRRYPVQTIAAAVALGFLIGRSRR
jgi:ElaB/YqjD/DUF883 family membrane-anchored ribosome-binding protein